MADKLLGLYIHVPFCMRKCAYCDFYSVPYNPDAMTAYARALAAQIRRAKPYAHGRKADTVYFGGGTPSLLSESDAALIISALRETFDITRDAEITLETNPGTVNSASLSAFHSAGVNRLSIGMQSASDAELKLLSRIHTREDFENTYLLARMEGFDNISFDIMYALPWQSEERLAYTVSYALELSPEHISFYGLKLEMGTPFGINPEIAAHIPDEDTQVAMYTKSAESFERRGYKQYEISNFAKAGRESRHNLKYWRSMDFLGFGPGAHSFIDGRLFSYKKDIKLFLGTENDTTLTEQSNTPTKSELETQYVMMAFRTSYGVDTDDWGKRFGGNFALKYYKKMKPFIDKGFIIQGDGSFRLSREGMLVSNYILSEILDFN